MDHLIDYIIEYMWHDKETFRKEWSNGECTSVSECLTYPLIKTYCDAIAALSRLK